MIGDPPRGDARYYLATVEYESQRCAGRQPVNETPSWRNAATLTGPVRRAAFDCTVRW